MEVAGTCAPTKQDGDLCSGDDHCNKMFFASLAMEPFLCNNPLGHVGRCVKVTRLNQTLGAACNPSFGMCEATRSTDRCISADQFSNDVWYKSDFDDLILILLVGTS